MTHTFLTPRQFGLYFLLLLAILSGFPLAAQQTPTAEPVEPPEATAEPFETTFGPGPFNLMTPLAGLSDLSSYRATLTVSFEGTREGQSEQWSRTYTMLVTQAPPARQLTIEKSGDAAGQVYTAEVSGTLYERRDGGDCIAVPVEAEGAFAATWEPAGFLDSIIGADDAGAETIDGVAAEHYTFDERAHGASDIADSTGDVWVASDGGYVVRYMLVTTGDAAYFGADVQGTITWAYNLGDVNQPLAVEVPEDCPPAVLDIAVMPDATDITVLPGFTSYTTLSGLDAVVAFYLDMIAASGAQPANPPLVSDTTALLGFMHGDEPIVVAMDASLGPTTVAIYRVADPAALSITVEVPDTAVREEEPSGNCALGADNFPMLDDANSVQRMPGLLSYMTAASVADAAAFYEEQFAALGGQVTLPLPASDMMAMLEARQGQDVFTMTIASMGGSTNVTIIFASLSGGTPLTACTAPESAEQLPAACSVSTATGANQRSGPGTNFERAGTLAGGVLAPADGQATGADGFVWWRLGAGVWVRSDVVEETGSCDGLPLVQP